jgi:TolA-binding protein
LNLLNEVSLFLKSCERALILVMSLLLVGCADSVRRDLIHLENSVDDFRALYSEQNGKLEQLEERLRSLQGRVEELEYSQKRTLGDEVSSLRDALSTLKRRVPPPGIVPEAALESAEASSKALPSEIAGLVSSSLGMIREGSFDKAIPLLDAALEKGEGQNFSAEILFWLGVCHDGQEDYRQALLAYHRIISLSADSPLAAVALFRQANVFLRMNDRKSYLATLRKLTSTYPRSAESKEARKLLAANSD